MHRIADRFILSSDDPGADHGGKDADGADQQRVDDQFQRKRARPGHSTVVGYELGVQHRGGTQDDRRDERHLITFEHVGRHSGAVADVVAHVVGNHGRVPRVVFGDPDLHLPHEIGAHVRSLGVNPAAHTHEGGHQGAAETEADQHAHRILFERHEDDGGAQQPQAHREHSGDRARLEAGAQRLPVTAPRGVCHAHVAVHGRGHADETRAV